ncbi:mucoidy inhibitor MuiA family protein [uncultured Croceitalea sp.]|uniref:DUF4139 domain-containing protein n=1 Tax=uncultured Croceitalea sp. TaxID=1798908 RepID=UPI00330590FC
MKKLFFLLFVVPILLTANTIKLPSTIKAVTVYLSGAQIQRNTTFSLKPGISEVILIGLSHKIDENSIQVSGLQSVSILSMAYDINYLEKSESHPQTETWQKEMEQLSQKINMLKNSIAGLKEEELVITKNRLVAGNNQTLDIQKVKEISTYYRERITAIKNAIYTTNLKINKLNKTVQGIQNQLAEANSAPEEPQGELTLKFDAPVTTALELKISYFIHEAGWIPNYDIKSKALNAPLNLAYKANVYQNTGQDWKNVEVTLSTGNPNFNLAKPRLDTKYLNFVSAYNRPSAFKTRKKGYAYNPMVRKVVGTITDASGEPLPGVNVVIKGTSNGTQTDFDGKYAVDIQNGQELEFSYIGQKSIQLPVYSSIMNIQMEEDTAVLDEVIVMGYGSTRSNTSAVSSVNLEQRLQGRAAGVNIVNSSGRTGGVHNVRVRGISNLSNYTPPLYIIDGVPVKGYEVGDLDENEIQNIETLKSETAAAIYGSRSANGVVLITTKRSTLQDDLSNAKFIIKKPYTIASDGDITAIEINTFKFKANYEYFAAPIINENVFLTASFTDWEKHQLLPGEANIYYEGTFAGKTSLDPYTVKKEMVLSLGIDQNISVTRKQERNFKSKSFTGSNRILDRVYNLEIKNNKNTAINIKLMDRIPKSQNKQIKVDDILSNNADYDKERGLLSWNIKLNPQETQKERFSFTVKYPSGRYISL